MKLSDLKGLRDVPPSDDDKAKELSSRQRKDWNDFVTHLDKKGLRGNPILDKGDRGNKEIDEYRKINPTTSITRESVPQIQQEFSKYRDWTINELRNKRAVLTDAQNPTGRFVTPNENLDNYMKDLSVVDGYSGSKTTSHSFPESYLKTFINNKLADKKNLGFATTK